MYIYHGLLLKNFSETKLLEIKSITKDHREESLNHEESFASLKYNFILFLINRHGFYSKPFLCSPDRPQKTLVVEPGARPVSSHGT